VSKPCCKCCSIVITGGLIIMSCYIHGVRTECVPRQSCAVSSELEAREPFHTENEIKLSDDTARIESRISSNVAAVTQSVTHSADAWIEIPDARRND
jgi:hypothetical protein